MWTHSLFEFMRNDVILFCRSNVKRPVVASSLQQQSQQDQPTPSTVDLKQPDEDVLLADNGGNMNTNINTNSNSKSKANSDSNNNNSNNNKLLLSWTLPDDRLISEDQRDKYEILETGDLLIKDLRWSDMGSYVCTVSDDQGSDSISTFVYPTSSRANSKLIAAKDKLQMAAYGAGSTGAATATTTTTTTETLTSSKAASRLSSFR